MLKRKRGEREREYKLRKDREPKKVKQKTVCAEWGRAEERGSPRD